MGSLSYRPFLAALLVFLAGFGAMNAFWFSGTWPTSLRGLWSFRAATLGDGILLPLAAFLIVAMLESLKKVSGPSQLWIVGGLLGLLGGLSVIVSWRFDRNPELNWTMPEPGRFNAPGIYHAIFLVVMSTLFCGSLFQLAWRIRQWVEREPDGGRIVATSSGPILLTGCGIGFLVLVILDASTSLSAHATQVALAGALALTLVPIAGLMTVLGLTFRDSLVLVGFGILLGVGVGLASNPLYTSQSVPAVVIVVSICAGIALLGEAYASSAGFKWIRVIVAWLIYVGGFNLSMHHSGGGLAGTLGFALGGLFVSSFALWWELDRHEVRARRIFLLAFIAPTASVAVWAWSQNNPGANQRLAILVGFATITLFGFFMKLMAEIYADLVETDKNPRPEQSIERELWSTWITTGVVLLATLAATLTLLQPLGTELGLTNRSGSDTHLTVELGAVLLMASTILVATAALYSFGDTWLKHAGHQFDSDKKQLNLPILPMIGCTAGTLLLTFVPVGIYSDRASSAPLAGAQLRAFVVLCFFIAVVAALYIGDSIHANTSFIQLLEMPLGCLIFVASIAILNGIAIFRLLAHDAWTASSLVSMQTFYVVLFTLLGVVISWVSCCWLISQSTHPSLKNSRFISLHAPASGTLNDAMVLCALIILWLIVFGVLFRDVRGVAVITLVTFANALSVIFIGYEVANVATNNYEIHLRSERARNPMKGAMPLRCHETFENLYELNSLRIDRLEAHIDRHVKIGIALSPCSPIFACRWLFKRFVLVIPARKESEDEIASVPPDPPRTVD